MSASSSISDTKTYNPQHLELLSQNNNRLALFPELLLKIFFIDHTPIDKSVPSICKAINAVNVEGLKKYLKNKIFETLPELDAVSEVDIFEFSKVNNKFRIEKKQITYIDQIASQQLLQNISNEILPSIAINGIIRAIYNGVKHTFHHLNNLSQPMLFKIKKFQGSEEPSYQVIWNNTAIENETLSSWQIQVIKEAVIFRNNQLESRRTQ